MANNFPTYKAWRIANPQIKDEAEAKQLYKNAAQAFGIKDFSGLIEDPAATVMQTLAPKAPPPSIAKPQQTAAELTKNVKEKAAKPEAQAFMTDIAAKVKAAEPAKPAVLTDGLMPEEKVAGLLNTGEEGLKNGLPMDAEEKAKMDKYKKYLEANGMKDSDQEFASWVQMEDGLRTDERRQDSKAFDKATAAGGITGGLTPLSAQPATGTPAAYQPAAKTAIAEDAGPEIAEQKSYETIQPAPGPIGNEAEQKADIKTTGPVVNAAAAEAGLADKKGEVDWDKVAKVAKDTGLGILGVMQAAIAGWVAGRQNRGLEYESETILGRNDVEKRGIAAEQRRLEQEQALMDAQSAAASAGKAEDQKFTREQNAAERLWQLSYLQAQQEAEAAADNVARAYEDRVRGETDALKVKEAQKDRDAAMAQINAQSAARLKEIQAQGGGGAAPAAKLNPLDLMQGK